MYNVKTNSINENETQENNTNSSDSEPKTDEEKAISIVKKEWGADNSVDFVFDHVENDEYIVAVKDRSTATVKYYFRVNLETKTVEMD